MSYPDPPPTPSREPPKTLYDFDAVKWEHQPVTESGGEGRACYLALTKRRV